MISLNIEGQIHKMDKSRPLIEGLNALGFKIPALCYHPQLNCKGVCRTCLVEKNGEPILSCLTRANEGDSLKVNSQDLLAKRSFLLSLLSSILPSRHRGFFGPRRYDSLYVVKKIFNNKRLQQEKEKKISTGLYYNSGLCIGCGLCPQFMDSYGEKSYSVSHNKVSFTGEVNFEFKRNLVEICPTGAFFDDLFLKGYSLKKLKSFHLSILGEKKMILTATTERVIRVRPEKNQFIKDSFRHYFEKAQKNLFNNQVSDCFSLYDLFNENIDAFIIDNIVTEDIFDFLKKLVKKNVEIFFTPHLERSPFTGMLKKLKKDLYAKLWNFNYQYEKVFFYVSDFYTPHSNTIPENATLLTSCYSGYKNELVVRSVLKDAT